MAPCVRKRKRPRSEPRRQAGHHASRPSVGPEAGSQRPLRKGSDQWFESRVGVGPWEQEYPGVPLPTEEHFDPELLAHGDRRNVVDAYRSWKMDAIGADSHSRRHELHSAIQYVENDANTATAQPTPTA